MLYKIQAHSIGNPNTVNYNIDGSSKLNCISKIDEIDNNIIIDFIEQL